MLAEDRKEAMIQDLEEKLGYPMSEIIELLRSLNLESIPEKVSEQKSEKQEIAVKQKITNLLKQMGIPANLKGYNYVRRAIEIAYEDPDMIHALTKVLYPQIAKEFGTTSSRVERAIRHAIEVACDRGDIDVLNQYFAYTISHMGGKPTNSEFIASIVDSIQISEEE